MNDSRNEKAWNDPPLFSLDQMSKATNPTVISRRNRYPQQSTTNQSMNPMINPMDNQMVSTDQQNYGSNQMSNQSSYGQPFQQSNQPSFGQPLQQQHNPISNQTSFRQNFQQQQQQQKQPNPVLSQSYGQPSQQSNAVSHNFQTDYAFDIQGFVGTVQALINSANHLPQELVIQWQNIQNHLYGIPIESQTKVILQSIYSSLQIKDFNNCRNYCNYLANDSNQLFRNIASILSQIFRYFP